METNEAGGVGCVIGGIATHKLKRPGAFFFSCPLNGSNHAWVYVVNNPTPPSSNRSGDLTRRGGSVVSEEDKQRELQLLLTGRSNVFRSIIEATPAANITRAGLFNRSNLELPHVDGRVALLGDAAHPQSPMMGQGAVRCALLKLELFGILTVLLFQPKEHGHCRWLCHGKAFGHNETSSCRTNAI